MTEPEPRRGISEHSIKRKKSEYLRGEKGRERWSDGSGRMEDRRPTTAERLRDVTRCKTQEIMKRWANGNVTPGRKSSPAAPAIKLGTDDYLSVGQ